LEDGGKTLLTINGSFHRGIEGIIDGQIELRRNAMRIGIGAAVACVFALSMGLTPTAQGRPSYAITRNNDCSACHTTEVTGRMEVTGQDLLTDLGTQLDGNIRGPLKTFQATPGEIVTLSVKVLDGNARFAVQLKDFEKGGRLKDPNNHLIWSEANGPGNVWTRQQGGNPPYFTKDNGSNGGISGSITPATHTFDLLIEPGTPLDFYERVFAVPGRRVSFERVYQEEHFYVQVLCPFELAGDLNEDCRVDFTDFALMAANWLTDCFLAPTDPACVPK